MDDVPDSGNSERVRSLAASLDCLTEEEFCALYDISPVTARAWRKRGTGPAYIIAGCRTLYPRRCVAADLQTRLRERAAVPAKELL